ncbi:hypothetical protein L3i23_07410 [Herbiconiux sp. L3-i23]|nr:hypothetical protein L3i23_07410 [Herbiconiux sp. L3-i23]
MIFGAAAIAAVVAMTIATRNSGRPTRGSGSIGSGVLGGVDEVFAPTKHEARLENDRQTSMPAPAPAPGDGDRGIFEGRIRIRVADTDHTR